MIFLFYCFAMSQYHQFLHAIIHIKDIAHDDSACFVLVQLKIFGKKRQLETIFSQQRRIDKNKRDKNSTKMVSVFTIPICASEVRPLEMGECMFRKG